MRCKCYARAFLTHLSHVWSRQFNQNHLKNYAGRSKTSINDLHWIRQVESLTERFDYTLLLECAENYVCEVSQLARFEVFLSENKLSTIWLWCFRIWLYSSHWLTLVIFTQAWCHHAITTIWLDQGTMEVYSMLKSSLVYTCLIAFVVTQRYNSTFDCKENQWSIPKFAHSFDMCFHAGTNELGVSFDLFLFPWTLWSLAYNITRHFFRIWCEFQNNESSKIDSLFLIFSPIEKASKCVFVFS